MSEKKVKIPTSKLPVSSMDKHKIKNYVLNGTVEMKDGSTFKPNNLNQAFRAIQPDCNRKSFNAYVNHVKSSM